jgi:ribosomal protein S18 acetylase RimI-like enzyme
MYSITQATAADLPIMVALLQQLFSIEKDFMPNAEKQRRGLELLLQNPQATVLVAKNATQVIGMCSVQQVVSTAQGSYAAWVEDVIVAEEFRHHGVATALLEAAVTWAKQHGATRLQLLVDTENLPALQFYERLGWRTTQLAARHFFV